MFSSKPEELHEKLNGNEIHRLENIITLEQDVHTAFDDLSLWFKPVAVCLTLLLYTLINGCYRTLLINTQFILEVVLENWQVDHYPRRPPSPQQISNFESLPDTILNYMHSAVR